MNRTSVCPLGSGADGLLTLPRSGNRWAIPVPRTSRPAFGSPLRSKTAPAHLTTPGVSKGEAGIYPADPAARAHHRFCQRKPIKANHSLQKLAESLLEIGGKI
jgi:hypothetical protein